MSLNQADQKIYDQVEQIDQIRNGLIAQFQMINQQLAGMVTIIHNMRRELYRRGEPNKP